VFFEDFQVIIMREVCAFFMKAAMIRVAKLTEGIIATDKIKMTMNPTRELATTRSLSDACTESLAELSLDSS
jgi:hypothetical protein